METIQAAMVDPEVVRKLLSRAVQQLKLLRQVPLDMATMEEVVYKVRVALREAQTLVGAEAVAVVQAQLAEQVIETPTQILVQAPVELVANTR